MFVTQVCIPKQELGNEIKKGNHKGLPLRKTIDDMVGAFESFSGLSGSGKGGLNTLLHQASPASWWVIVHVQPACGK